VSANSRTWSKLGFKRSFRAFELITAKLISFIIISGSPSALGGNISDFCQTVNFPNLSLLNFDFSSPSDLMPRKVE